MWYVTATEIQYLEEVCVSVERRMIMTKIYVGWSLCGEDSNPKC